jgi:hypothetical protein
MMFVQSAADGRQQLNQLNQLIKIKALPVKIRLSPPCSHGVLGLARGMSCSPENKVNSPDA